MNKTQFVVWNVWFTLRKAAAGNVVQLELKHGLKCLMIKECKENTWTDKYSGPYEVVLNVLNSFRYFNDDLQMGDTLKEEPTWGVLVR